MKKLATRINQLSKDFDLYEYRDTVENEEDFVNSIAELLLNGDLKPLIEWLEEILESEEMELHEEAKSILEEVNALC